MLRRRKYIILIGLALLTIGVSVYFKNQQEQLPEITSLPEDQITDAKINGISKNIIKSDQNTTPSITPRVTSPGPSEEVREEFKAMIRETWNKFPTVTQIRKLPTSEVHHTPSVILQAGSLLGEISTRLKEHPELVSEAIGFYRDCSKNSEFPTAIRAVCYADLMQRSPDTLEKDSNDPDIGDDVKRLAASLPKK